MAQDCCWVFTFVIKSLLYDHATLKGYPLSKKVNVNILIAQSAQKKNHLEVPRDQSSNLICERHLVKQGRFLNWLK